MVAAVTREHFDLALTDIHMPGLDGVEATKRIRAEEKADEAARACRSWRSPPMRWRQGGRACQEAGMDGFLTKPIDPAELDSMFAKIFSDAESSARNAAA